MMYYRSKAVSVDCANIYYVPKFQEVKLRGLCVASSKCSMHLYCLVTWYVGLRLFPFVRLAVLAGVFTEIG